MMGCLGAEVGHPAQDHHATAHASCTNHGKAATAEVAINANDRDHGCDEEPSRTAAREEESNPVLIPKLLSEHASEKLDEEVYAGELLEELQYNLKESVSEPRELKGETKLTRKNETMQIAFFSHCE